jgi:hypothetical protein
MHLLPNALPIPRRFDSREQTNDIVSSFSQLVIVEDNVVMMEIEAERDIEFFADG